MSGIVYVMSDGDRPHLKIGWTARRRVGGEPEPARSAGERRERQLRTGNPQIRLIRFFEHRNRDLETYLHQQFLGRRVRNEFFDVTLEEVEERVAAFRRILADAPDDEEVSRVERMSADQLTEPRAPTNREAYLVDRVLELQAQIKGLKLEADALVAELKVSAGAASAVTGYLTFDAQTRTSLDTRAIRRDHPELCARYERETSSRAFRIRRSLFED